MQETTISKLALTFIIYSVIGWICETIWCSVGQRKLVNRGFLSGPWCPIYGFGGLIILFFTAPARYLSPLAVFVMSMASTTALEYFTGWMLETLFQTRWWDYSKRKFNIKGRVCLRNSVIFGLLGLGVVYFIDPFVQDMIGAVAAEIRWTLTLILCVLMIIDLTRSLISITALKERLGELKALLDELEEYQELYAWFDKSDITGSIARLKEICENFEASKQSAEILERINRLERRKGGSSRMAKAFPNMQPKGFAKELEALRHSWSDRRNSRKKDDA